MASGIKAAIDLQKKAISDIINNAPQSSSSLNRSTYQKVSPEYALERLSTKEKIKSINPQWGPCI